MDTEYDANVAKIDALITEGEEIVARQLERLQQMLAAGYPADDAQRTLALMQELMDTHQRLRRCYIKMFRERLH